MHIIIRDEYVHLASYTVLSGGSRIWQGETMASARSAVLNRGLGRAPSGVHGQNPWWWSEGRSPLKLKAFCPFSYKKCPKVKDLNENLPPCLRQTAFRSHARPALSFSQWGPGRAPGPPIAGSATDREIASSITAVALPGSL